MPVLEELFKPKKDINLEALSFFDMLGTPEKMNKKQSELPIFKSVDAP